MSDTGSNPQDARPKDFALELHWTAPRGREPELGMLVFPGSRVVLRIGDFSCEHTIHFAINWWCLNVVADLAKLFDGSAGPGAFWVSENGMISFRAEGPDGVLVARKPEKNAGDAPALRVPRKDFVEEIVAFYEALLTKVQAAVPEALKGEEAASLRDDFDALIELMAASGADTASARRVRTLLA